MKVDYDLLGNQLVGLLEASLKTPSADTLKKIAKDCLPSIDDEVLALEILYFHMFLLVQACTFKLPEDVGRQIVAAFYVAQTREMRSRFGLDKHVEEVFQSLWVKRANQYDEPFDADIEEDLKPHDFHLPWKRLIATFINNFKETSDSVEAIWSTHHPIEASLFVASTYAEILSKIGLILRSQQDET